MVGKSWNATMKARNENRQSRRKGQVSSGSRAFDRGDMSGDARRAPHANVRRRHGRAAMSSVVGTAEHPLRVAIVGTGPSGMYAADGDAQWMLGGADDAAHSG